MRAAEELQAIYQDHWNPLHTERLYTSVCLAAQDVYNKTHLIQVEVFGMIKAAALCTDARLPCLQGGSSLGAAAWVCPGTCRYISPTYRHNNEKNVDEQHGSPTVERGQVSHRAALCAAGGRRPVRARRAQRGLTPSIPPRPTSDSAEGGRSGPRSALHSRAVSHRHPATCNATQPCRLEALPCFWGLHSTCRQR
ncbi:hypothetical protein NDU88_000990 [Pleurodeles waltl]|uniref:Uncharacterized protein n=1 Tax=Pleurodeles waltl TaxID=8319 RepID=A0AAV7M6W4_PLEWA|nr:hypothetical protein NDU88_000990 [Pleurodeles waltl]